MHLVDGRARRRAASARRAAPTTLAPTWASRSPARSTGVRLLARRMARTPASSTHGRDAQALLLDLDGVGRHRARRGAADVGVVGPVGGPARRGGRRGGTGVTRVMSLRWVPPAKGSLTMTWCAGARVADAVDGGPHRRRHRAEVDRDVLGLHEQVAVGGEQRGRAVGPLLDVGAEGGAAQDGAHLVGDAGEAGQEDGQAGRAEGRAPVSMAPSVTRDPPQDVGAGGAGLGPPAVGDPDRAVGLGDDGGAGRPGGGRAAGRSVDGRPGWARRRGPGGR